VAGRYQLVKKLATGGMAEIFLARAAGPGGFEKSLVVKRILPQLAERESFVQMFFAEARIAAQLTHPNIVQIFDFGEDEGSYFIAMEYVDGVTLRAIAKWAPTNAPVSPLMAAKIIALAAEGLGWAHDYRHPETGQPLGIVHRDVSADNIMVSRTGAVKVLDFGVVRIDGEDHGTEAGALKGKVAYMPPEQILGDALDGRVDVYALGVVLYFLLTGARPYDKPSEVALMHAILSEGPRPLTQFRQDVPEALVAIVERAMARSADGRFATCFELQGALEQFIASSGASVSTAQLGQLVARVREAQPGGEGKGTAGSRSGVGSAASSSSGVRMATPPSQRGPASAPPPAVFDGPELGQESPTNVDLAAIRAPAPVVDPFKTNPGMPASAVLAELRARAAAADEGPALEPEPGASPAAPQPISLETVPVMQALPKVGWWNERTPLSSPSAAGLLSTPSRGVEPAASTVVSPPRPSSLSELSGLAAAAGGPATTPPRASSPSGVGGRSTPAGGLLGASGAPAAPPRASSPSGSVWRPVMTPTRATSVVDDGGLNVTTPSFAAERATTAPMEAVARGLSITAAPPSPMPGALDASHVTAPASALPPPEPLAAEWPRASSPPSAGARGPPEGPAPRLDGAPAAPLAPPPSVPMPPPGGGAVARPSSPTPALGRAVAPPTLSPNASPPCRTRRESRAESPRRRALCPSGRVLRSPNSRRR
jgi:serine/threonine-protein kinase